MLPAGMQTIATLGAAKRFEQVVIPARLLERRTLLFELFLLLRSKLDQEKEYTTPFPLVSPLSSRHLSSPALQLEQLY